MENERIEKQPAKWGSSFRILNYFPELFPSNKIIKVYNFALHFNNVLDIDFDL